MLSIDYLYDFGTKKYDKTRAVFKSYSCAEKYIITRFRVFPRNGHRRAHQSRELAYGKPTRDRRIKNDWN